MKPVLFTLTATAIAIISLGFIDAGATDRQEKIDNENTYNFTQPDETHELPSELTEVSGLTDLNATQVACVQDEKGIVFTYDLMSKKIEKEIAFAGDGDYEGLTRVDDILFSLSSEGTLYEIETSADGPHTKNYSLDLPSPDNEGLCYDEKDKRLLIAPKSKLGKGPEFKDSRAIYAFDVKKRKLEKEPLFYYNVSDIYAFAEKNNLPVHPTYKKNGGASKHPNFRPSSISVHPKTDEIYVISAEDMCMVTFDKEGSITGFVSLDPEIFSKPEGLTFLPDGTLLITNEGVGNHATLLVFREK